MSHRECLFVPISLMFCVFSMLYICLRLSFFSAMYFCCMIHELVNLLPAFEIQKLSGRDLEIGQRIGDHCDSGFGRCSEIRIIALN